MCRAGVFSVATFGAVSGFFGGLESVRFARAVAGLGCGLRCGFFAGVFCPARFAVDERPFAADERFAFFGRALRDFAAAGFLRFGGSFLPDFDLDVEAIAEGLSDSIKTWMAGIKPGHE